MMYSLRPVSAFAKEKRLFFVSRTWNLGYHRLVMFHINFYGRFWSVLLLEKGSCVPLFFCALLQLQCTMGGCWSMQMTVPRSEFVVFLPSCSADGSTSVTAAAGAYTKNLRNVEWCQGGWEKRDAVCKHAAVLSFSTGIQ